MPDSSPPVLRRPEMSAETLFPIQLVFGYVAWLLCFSVYIWPRLKVMDRFAAQRAIATLHSFRFFGLVFILPGIVGPALPAGFATFAAYDHATRLGLPAMAGQLGSTYAIAIIYVPLLMITHVVAFYFLLRPSVS